MASWYLGAILPVDVGCVSAAGDTRPYRSQIRSTE